MYYRYILPSGCKVSPECYGRMTQMLRGLAGGRVVICLEGGYNVTSIAYAMAMCTKALLGDPIHHHYTDRPTAHWSAIESINNVIAIHKKYWKNLKFQLALPIENVLEPPLPSRGLKLDEADDKIELTLSCTIESKSSHDGSLESNMANLSIDKACSDGIHCGTDDEEEKPESSKRQTDSNKEEKAPSEQKTTLVDYLAENMQAIVDGEMFAVIPLPWCPHLESMFAIPSDVKFEQGVKCTDCDETVENWVCLHCYVVSILCELHTRIESLVLLEPFF